MAQSFRRALSTGAMIRPPSIWHSSAVSSLAKELEEVDQDFAFTAAPPTSFDIGEYRQRLSSSGLGSRLLHYTSVPSTQDVLATTLYDFQEPLVVVADLQTAGSGRTGNTWVSPQGSLLFSFNSSFPLSFGQNLPFVQYLVCLAVQRAIKSVSEVQEFPVAIKWPNDIYVQSTHKVGGILCRTSAAAGMFHVVTGVGLNVSNTSPTTCLNAVHRTLEAPESNRATSTHSTRWYAETAHRSEDLTPPSAAAGAAEAAPGPTPASEKGGEDDTGLQHGPFSREALLAEICNALDLMLPVFRSSGFEPFVDEYHSAWLHSGQRVRVRNAKSVSAKPPSDVAAGAGAEGVVDDTIEVEVRGINVETGGLRAVDEAGTEYDLQPDGNRFDFMSGLIYRRV